MKTESTLKTHQSAQRQCCSEASDQQNFTGINSTLDNRTAERLVCNSRYLLTVICIKKLEVCALHMIMFGLLSVYYGHLREMSCATVFLSMFNNFRWLTKAGKHLKA